MGGSCIDYLKGISINSISLLTATRNFYRTLVILSYSLGLIDWIILSAAL